LTTFAQNITALEVDGVFDDCQEMVKQAFLDADITQTLTSANSINVARWLPQMFYFFFAYKQVHQQQKEIVFSVPSGNFGNICAGLMAKRIGLPVKHFIAATNINDTVPNYMESGSYIPKPSKATISNAMDVGNPSNFIRIQELFDNNLSMIKQAFSSYSFTDEETRESMKSIYKDSNYVADPHGAVGYLGLLKYGLSDADFGIFFETAHPVKFLDVVEDTLPIQIEIPEQIKKVIDKQKSSIKIASYEELKSFLNNN
jgi:threonine synthase